MSKTYFEAQYSVDGKTWLRFLGRHLTRKAATEYAEQNRNETIQTRVVKINAEVLEGFDKLPGKKAPPIIVPGLGVIS